MKLIPRHLNTEQEPLNIEHFQDGQAYKIPLIHFSTTNRWMDIACIDDVFIKLPSERGILDYRRLLKLGLRNRRGFRAIRREERFELLQSHLERYPEFAPLVDRYSDEVAHYLLVYKLQHLRLHQSGRIALPETRFVVLEMEDSTGFAPAVIQAGVRGFNLIEMYDFEHHWIRPEWRPYLPTLSEQLLPVMFSDIRKDIDWNFRNFVFEEREKIIYYIDAKPSILFRKRRNRENFSDVVYFFTVQPVLEDASQEEEEDVRSGRPRDHTAEVVTPPLKLRHFCDGHVYNLPQLEFITTNIFMKIAFEEHVVLKLPANKTCYAYDMFLKPGLTNPRAIRGLEWEERIENLEEMLKHYPEFVRIFEQYHPDLAHYLLMLKLHYQRLVQGQHIHLPDTRFVLIEIDGMLDVYPAAVQERIVGTNLFDMCDDDGDFVLPEWRSSLPRISDHIVHLLHSNQRDHIDWNTRNFMLDASKHTLYYIDIKPTMIPSRPRSEANLRELLRLFTV